MAAKSMTKAELVSAVAEAAESDKAAVNRLLTALAKVVSDEVSRGGSVTLPGLGKFACRDRPARTVRNPATGQQVEKPADRVAKVTVSKQLNELLNA